MSLLWLVLSLHRCPLVLLLLDDAPEPVDEGLHGDERDHLEDDGLLVEPQLGP